MAAVSLVAAVAACNLQTHEASALLLWLFVLAQKFCVSRDLTHAVGTVAMRVAEIVATCRQSKCL